MFRIYYADGSTYDGDPFVAPPDGVICIVKLDQDNGRFLVAQRDYYWFDGEWFGGDLFGLFDHLRQPGPRKVVFGRFVTNRVYQKVIGKALADPDFPPKSARHPEEIY